MPAGNLSGSVAYPHKLFGFKADEVKQFRGMSEPEKLDEDGPAMGEVKIPQKTLEKQKPLEPKTGNPLDLAFEKWSKRQGPAETGELLRAAAPTISSAMTTYGGNNPGLLMRSRARLLAIQAAKSFNPKSGAKLSTWLMQNMKGLQRYSQKASPIRMPERVSYELSHVDRTRTELAEELGREPNDEELSDGSGISLTKLLRIRKFGNKLVNESSLADNEGSPYLPGVSAQTPEAIWAEYVYHDLDPIGKQVYNLLTGRGGQPVIGTSEIARKLKLSPSAISQRASRIASKLEAFHNG